MSRSNVAPISRRSVLLQAAASAVALTTAGSLSRNIAMSQEPTTAKPSFSGAIDAHVHVWTPDTERYPLAAGFSKENMKPASFTPEELLALARPSGVDRIVLIQMSFYKFDNSYMLDTMKRYPGVFAGVGIVDHSALRPDAAMLDLARQGVTGFRIAPAGAPPASWLDSPGMETMWKVGAEHRLALCPLIDAAYLDAVDAMCAKYPDTPVVIDHCARIGTRGSHDAAEIDKLCRLARHKNTHVKVSAFYALSPAGAPYLDVLPMIRRLRDAYGAGRLMWASDCPFQVQKGHRYDTSIALIREHADFLTSVERQAILRDTAARVYFRTA